MDRNKIIDKIKKCLALANSSNEHEAAQALKQAHALMRIYNVSEIDIELGSITKHHSSQKTSNTLWKKQLILMIGKFFCVVPIFSGNQISWNGKELNTELAEYAYISLLRLCSEARAQYMQTELSRVRIKANKTVRANNYALGWCSTVYNSIASLIDSQSEEYKRLHDLILASDDSLKTTESSSSKKHNAFARKYYDKARGQKDGQKVNLHRPLTGQQNFQLKLD